MAVNDLKLVAFLKTRMQWHQARQGVLAQNVANADTPGYRPSDLKAPHFDEPRVAALAPVTTVRTHAAHVSVTPLSPGGGRFAAGGQGGWEMTPGGNAVVLEEQMMKVAANQFDYQLASTLYARSLGLLRSALGRS